MMLPSESLKVVFLNAENLFLLSDHPLTKEDLEKSEEDWQELSTSIYPNKSLYRCFELAKFLKGEDPDFILLCEVGGPESLSNFSRLFLQNLYQAHIIPGNSDRNIDLGLLAHRRVQLSVRMKTNKDRPINELGEKFARDLAEFHVYAARETQPQGEPRSSDHLEQRPLFSFLLVHLKSRLDPTGKDPSGNFQRKCEMDTLIKIYGEHKNLFGPNHPTLIAGDFNGNASPEGTDPEFQSIYSTTDLIELGAHFAHPKEDLFTFYQVGRRGSEGRQLDYFFANPCFVRLVDPTSFRVHRYLSPNGLPAPPPRSLEAKALFPSDHYPLILKFNRPLGIW